jgi:hypothetical protein
MLRGFHIRPYRNSDGGSGGGAEAEPQGEADKPTRVELSPEQQELFNRKFAQAKRAEQASARQALLAELGVSDPEEVKRILAEKKEREEGEKSEVEKLAARLAETEKKRDAALAQAQRAILLSNIQAHATTLNFHDPKDAALHLDLSTFQVDLESAAVEGVEDALKALAKSKPYLVKTATQTAPDINAGARGNGKTPIATDEDRKRAEERYRLTF